MSDEEFEWDPNKAEANARRHRVTFAEASRVFEDTNVLLETDDDLDESRSIAIGLRTGRILLVVYTERGDRTRIISARKATRH